MVIATSPHGCTTPTSRCHSSEPGARHDQEPNYAGRVLRRPHLVPAGEEGYGPSVTDVINDQSMRTEIYDAIQRVFDHHDLLVTPTLATLPPENADDGNTVGPSQINGVEVDALIGWCMTYFLNFSGHPAASIPAGLANGIPVGMQLIGRRYADADVIAASATFERLRPWHDHYQICANRGLE